MGNAQRKVELDYSSEAETPSEKLGFEEASEFYQLIRYFGHHDIEDAGEEMFRDESVPLENHWNSSEEFIVVYRALWRFARQKNEDLFVSAVVSDTLANSVLMSVEEKEIMEACGMDINEQAVWVYRFLLSMKFKFEWDMAKFEAGLFYPMVL
jgi:hypothetical protein